MTVNQSYLQTQRFAKEKQTLTWVIHDGEKTIESD